MGKARWIIILLVVISATGLVYHGSGGNEWLAVHAAGSVVLLVWTVFHYIRFGPRRRKRRAATQETAHIILDRQICQACWKCVDNCPKKVFGKVNLPFHKHAIVVNPDDCIGCKKCVKGCECGALTSRE